MSWVRHDKVVESLAERGGVGVFEDESFGSDALALGNRLLCVAVG